MMSREVTTGRTMLAVLEPGDNVLPALLDVCADAGITQAFTPVFFGAFREMTIIATDQPIEDEDAPLGDSITVRNAEGLGSGTLAPGADEPVLHLHAAVGLKAELSRGVTGHVLSAIVQYPTEVVITEILSPTLVRRPNPAARGLATLTFDDD